MLTLVHDTPKAERVRQILANCPDDEEQWDNEIFDALIQSGLTTYEALNFVDKVQRYSLWLRKNQLRAIDAMLKDNGDVRHARHRIQFMMRNDK